MLELLWSSGFMILSSLLPVYANSKFPRSGKEHLWLWSQNQQSLWGTNPKSYRPISLLCVPYKILEKLIYARVEPLIDPLLPKEQAGFRHGKSTVDQVVLLTQNIKDSFEAKKKASAIFVGLTAAYDTVQHRGLTCKLLRLLPDKHMVKMIMEFAEIKVLPLLPVTASKAGYAVLKTAFLRAQVLTPLLFNMYMYDLPSMISRKFAYADDLALLYSSGNWKDLEGTLSQDMITLSAYHFSIFWNVTKTVFKTKERNLCQPSFLFFIYFFFLFLSLYLSSWLAGKRRRRYT